MKLGKNQRAMLDCLKRHNGYWHSGCGWYWDTDSGTRRILDSLVRRGLVVRTESAKCFGPYNARVRYDITEEGRSHDL